MSALAGLKLVAAKRSTSVAPVVQRRTKLLKKLGEQIELAKAQKEGRQYSATRMRNVNPPKIPGGATLVFEVELLKNERRSEL